MGESPPEPGTRLSREWVAPQDVSGASAERQRRHLEGAGRVRLVRYKKRRRGRSGSRRAAASSPARSAATWHRCRFLGSAAVRLALAPQARSLPAGIAALLSSQHAIGVALLEAGSGWTVERAGTRLSPGRDGLEIRGEKVAIEQLQAVGQLAVVATLDGEPALAITPAGAAGLIPQAQRCFDETVLMGTARFNAVPVPGSGVLGGPEARQVLRRLMTAGSLLAAAEAVGAAGHILDLACRYAGDRRRTRFRSPRRPLGCPVSSNTLTAPCHTTSPLKRSSTSTASTRRAGTPCMCSTAAVLRWRRARDRHEVDVLLAMRPVPHPEPAAAHPPRERSQQAPAFDILHEERRAKRERPLEVTRQRELGRLGDLADRGRHRMTRRRAGHHTEVVQAPGERACYPRDAAHFVTRSGSTPVA